MGALEGRQVVFVAVQALTARDQFRTSKEQVEGIGELRSLWVWIGVKGAFAHGVADHEQEVAAKLLRGPLAQPALVLRRKVRLAAHIDAMQLEDQFLRVGKMNVRYPRRHCRYLHSQQRHLGLTLLAYCRQHGLDGFTQHGHHREVTLDKAHLGVQANIFVDMARGVVRLGAKDRTNLEDTLKDADHHLLIKLWTLRQRSRAVEVVQLEDVGPALGRGGHNLGCLNLCEALRA